MSSMISGTSFICSLLSLQGLGQCLAQSQGGCFVYSFMRWSDRYGHKRRHKRGSGKQNLLKFILLTGPRDRRLSIPHRTIWQRHQGGQEAEDRCKGKVWGTVSIEVSEGKARRGRVSNLGLAGLNNCDELWAIRVILCCLALALGWLRHRNSASWGVVVHRGDMALNQFVWRSKTCALLGSLLSLRTG